MSEQDDLAACSPLVNFGEAKNKFSHTKFACDEHILASQAWDQVLFKDLFQTVADHDFISVDGCSVYIFSERGRGLKSESTLEGTKCHRALFFIPIRRYPDLRASRMHASRVSWSRIRYVPTEGGGR